jgi:hypothetical protein
VWGLWIEIGADSGQRDDDLRRMEGTSRKHLGNMDVKNIN